MPYLRRNNGPSEMDISGPFLGPSYPLPEPQYKFALSVAICPLGLIFWRASVCPLLSQIVPSACYNDHCQTSFGCHLYDKKYIV